jgi:mannose-1-phosphate guanylyltransferase
MSRASLPWRRTAGVVVEPSARNTAAAIALAALRLPEDAVMLVCPSDHHIGNPEAFVEAARRAEALAQQGWLVAFGIAATAPETGFGYVKQGEEIVGSGGYKVDRFVEKPDLERAMQFLSEGTYSWNGGIFAFRAGDYLRELEAHRPDIAAAVREAVAQGHEDGHRFHPHAELFAAVPSNRSITLSWKRPSAPPSCPPPWRGATSATGMPCGKRATATRQATASSARRNWWGAATFWLRATARMSR